MGDPLPVPLPGLRARPLPSTGEVIRDTQFPKAIAMTCGVCVNFLACASG